MSVKKWHEKGYHVRHVNEILEELNISKKELCRMIGKENSYSYVYKMLYGEVKMNHTLLEEIYEVLGYELKAVRK